MARLHRRYRKTKKLRKNPDGGGSSSAGVMIADVAEFVIPGFAGFAATRFGTRIASTQIAKWKPQYAKHAGAAASVSAFLAAWLLAHRWKWLAKYQHPIVVGSAIAAIQSIIQLYIPRLGWMIADATPDIAASNSNADLLASAGGAQLPPGVQPLDEDPSLYVYNDAYDAGRYSTSSAAPATGNNTRTAAAQQSGQTDDDLLSDLNLNDNQSVAATGGIFGS